MARIASEKVYGLPKAPPRQRSVRRERDADYLGWLHELPCCVSGVTNGVIAHHITIDRGRMGVKSDDSLALPLLNELHDQHPGALHVIGEKRFWNNHGINPFLLAFSLHTVYTEYHKNLAFAKALLKAHREIGSWCRANGVTHFQEKTKAAQTREKAND